MKSKYCFIVHQNELTPEDKVFRVWIGGSQRDQVKRTLLDCYACDTGAYFRLWDVDTDFELIQKSKRFVTGSSLPAFPFKMVDVSVHKLYQSIIDDTLPSLENPPFVSRNLLHQMNTLKPSFYFQNRKKCQNDPATTVPRKYLKPSKKQEDVSAMISFGLISLLFLIGALLESLERVLSI